MLELAFDPCAAQEVFYDSDITSRLAKKFLLVVGTAISDVRAPVRRRPKLESPRVDSVQQFWKNEHLWRRAVELSAQVTCKLAEDTHDLREDEGKEVDPKIASDCLRLAQRIAPILALGNDIKFAPFAEESGSVTLVAQSLVTDRRISFHFTPAEKELQVVSIDEQMRTSAWRVAMSDTRAIEEIATWVTTRAKESRRF